MCIIPTAFKKTCCQLAIRTWLISSSGNKEQPDFFTFENSRASRCQIRISLFPHEPKKHRSFHKLVEHLYFKVVDQFEKAHMNQLKLFSGGCCARKEVFRDPHCLLPVLTSPAADRTFDVNYNFKKAAKLISCFR